jgi:hypothetical protein
MGSEKTKFARFLDREGLDVPTLSRKANLSQGNVYAIAAGRTVPRADTIGILRGAAAELLDRKDLDVSEMFDFPDESTR